MADNDLLRYMFEVDTRSGEASVKGFEQTLKNVGTTAQSAADSSGRAADQMTRAWETAKGVLAALGVTAGVTAAAVTFKTSVNEALDFQRELSNVQTLLVGTGIKAADLGNKLLQLGGEFGSSTELANALYEALSAGVEPAKSVEFVATATKLAKAELFEAGDATRLLATIMNAYGREITDVNHISDVFVETINVGIVRGEQLANALGGVIGTAAQAKVPIEEVAAAVAIMTRQGISADEAVTSLNQVILSFLSPSDKAKKAAHDMGVELNLSTLQSLGLKGAMELVAEKTGGSATKFAEAFDNVRALRGVLALTGAQSSDFSEIVDKMKTSVGQTTVAFKEQQENLKSQWTTAVNNAQRAVDQFVSAQGGPFVAALKSVNDQLRNGIDPLNKFNLAIAAVGVTMGGLAFASFVSNLTNAFAAATIFGAIKNVGDLRAAVALFAEAGGLGKVVTAVPVTISSLLSLSTAFGVGLAAAIGLAAGSLVNWLIEGTKVRTWIDSFVQTTLGPFVNKWVGVTAAQKETDAATKTLEDRLKAHGITVDATGLSTEQYRMKLIAAGRAAFEHTTATQGSTQASSDDAAAKAKAAEAAAAAAAAQTQLRQEIEKLKAPLTSIIPDAKNLNTAIIELQASGTPAAAIVEKLGKNAATSSDGVKLLGGTVPIAVTQIANLWTETQKAEEQQKKFRDEVDRFKSTATEQAAKAQALGTAITELKVSGLSTEAQIKLLGKAAVDTTTNFTGLGTELPKEVVALANAAKAATDAEAAHKKFRDEVDRFKTTGTDASAKASALATAITEMRTAGIPTEQIMKQLGDTAVTSSTNLRGLGQPIPEVVQNLANLKTATDQAKKSQEDFRNEVDRFKAAATPPTQSAQALAAAIGEMQTKGATAQQLLGTLGGSAQELANKLTAAGQAVPPAVQQLANMQQRATELKMVTDNLRESAGRIFDDMFVKGQNVFTSVVNMLKGGVLSIGRTIFQDVVSQAFAPLQMAFTDFFKGIIEGPVKQFLGNFTKGIGSTASGALNVGGGGLIGGAIAAAGIGIAALINSIGKGRKTANEFVQQYQNPFANNQGTGALNILIDSFNRFMGAGLATADDAVQTKKAVVDLWTQFMSNATTFAKQGQIDTTVVSQAYNTLNPLMAQIFADLDQSIITLRQQQRTGTAASTPPPAPPQYDFSSTPYAPPAPPPPAPPVTQTASGGQVVMGGGGGIAPPGSSAIAIPTGRGVSNQGVYDAVTNANLVTMEQIVAANAAGHFLMVRGRPVSGTNFMGGLLLGDGGGWMPLNVAIGGQGAWQTGQKEALQGAGLPVASFFGGTPPWGVPNTGMYLLHKGEEVRPDRGPRNYTSSTSSYDQRVENNYYSVDRVEIHAQPGQNGRQIAHELIKALISSGDQRSKFKKILGVKS